MTTQATSNTLVIERIFDASPERLWSYWTDPKKYAKWLSPQKSDLVIHEFDVRVGGRIRFDMPLDNGTTNHEEGVFHIIDAPRRLVSGSPDKSFLIDVTFIPVGLTTKLVAIVTGVPNEWHAAAKEGWATGFAKLDKLLQNSEPNPGAPSIKGISPPAKGRVTSDRFVELERWYKATPEKLYNAWTTPALLEKIFWPVGDGKVTKLDLKVGGHLEMAHMTQPWTALWEYVELTPDRKIVIRDIWPDGSGHSAIGTLTFTPENGGTRMKVRFGPFPTTGPYQPEMAVGGFAMGMDKAAEVLEVPGPGEGFRIERFFNAPVAKVWDLYTTKEGLARWWGPGANAMGFAFQVNTLDVRPGGKYDIQMSNEKQGKLHNHGTYTEVVKHKRFAQTWDFDIFLAPGEKPYPISITVEFEEVPTMEPGKTGTKLTFTQGPMAKPDFTEGSRQGVISNLSHMQAALGDN